MIPVHKVQSLWIKIMHAIHMFIYSSVQIRTGDHAGPQPTETLTPSVAAE